jgi:putative hydrolase of the HAD superfamily
VTLRPGIRAVFFDVGGPIYDDQNFVVAVLRALDDMRAEQGADPVDRTVFGEIYGEIRERQGGSLRTALATRLLGSADLRRELHERTRAYWVHPEGSMYDDVTPLLEQLHGRVTTGVLANQEAPVVDALRRDGLGDLIDVWGISAIVGHEKPSPELFTWALAQAGTDAGHAVHVGNRLDTDVRPAKALGLGTVWVTRGEAPDHPTADQLAEPDLAVPDLSTLADALLPLVEGAA